MPRIPKIRKTAFPDQMFMDRKTGALSRYDLFPEDWAAIRRTHVPVQGPELPQLLEQRRQYLRNAQEAYERDLAEERARQAYNRRVAAWNSYCDLPPRERAFIANQNRLRETLYDYMPAWEANQYARNYPNYEAMPPVEMMPGDKRTLDLDELNGFESFDEFPDNGWVDMPWNRWK